MDEFFPNSEIFFKYEHDCMVLALKHVLGGTSVDIDDGGRNTCTAGTAMAALESVQPQPNDYVDLQAAIEVATSSLSPMLPLGASSSTSIGAMLLDASAAGNHDTASWGNLGWTAGGENNDHEMNITSTSKNPFTQRQHQQEQKKKKKKTKKNRKNPRGVRQRSNSQGKWVVEIWDPHQGKKSWLGTFTSSEEAARAYDRKAIEYKGDKAITNFPLDDYPDDLLMAQQRLIRRHQAVGDRAAEANDPTQFLGRPYAAQNISGNNININILEHGNTEAVSMATDDSVAGTTLMQDNVDTSVLVDDDAALAEWLELVSKEIGNE